MTEGSFLGHAAQFSPVTRRTGDHPSNNSIAYSAVTAVDLKLDTSCFHIALPVKGTEPYQVDRQHFKATEEEYFVFNPDQEALCFGKFKNVVEGICIFLSPETLRETAQSMEKGLAKTLEQPFEYDWQRYEFLVKTYSLRENSFGKYLSVLKQTLLAVKSGKIVWEDESAIFSGLAAAFLTGHHQIDHHLKSIPALKSATREELYKRLASVHAFIAGSFGEKIQLDDLLGVACLSRYHLIRTYKKVYGKTPYQDILHRRLDAAKGLLSEGLSLEDIAFKLHFTDGKAFGKSFKKRFGFTPGQYLLHRNDNYLYF